MEPTVFHESYGEVTRAQLAAYRKHNVSPSDHDSLVAHLGNDSGAILAAVRDSSNHIGRSFSVYLWLESLRVRRGF